MKSQYYEALRIIQRQDLPNAEKALLFLIKYLGKPLTRCSGKSGRVALARMRFSTSSLKRASPSCSHLCTCPTMKVLTNLFPTLISPILQIVLRKLAGRFLCEVTYASVKAQNIICAAQSFTPVKGKVCLNNMPVSIQKRLQEDPGIL